MKTDYAPGLFSDLVPAGAEVAGFAVQSATAEDGAPASWVIQPDGAGYKLFTGPGHFRRAMELAGTLSAAYWLGWHARDKETRA